jgi:hypothetical protein
MSFLRDPKRLIATLIAGAAGVIVLIDFAGAINLTDQAARVLVDWAALLAALALLVGLLSVAAGHFMRVLGKRPDWGYSLVLLISMLLVVVTGTLIGIVPNPGGGVNVVMLPGSLIEQPIRDVFRAFYQPLAGSFLALLAFFSLSAALRSLRRRTLDAVVIIVVALVVLALAAIPQAQALLGSGVGWISDYVALAGARGLLLGAALGAVVAGVRVLLGFDQPYLDR